MLSFHVSVIRSYSQVMLNWDVELSLHQGGSKSTAHVKHWSFNIHKSRLALQYKAVFGG